MTSMLRMIYPCGDSTTRKEDSASKPGGGEDITKIIEGEFHVTSHRFPILSIDFMDCFKVNNVCGTE